MTKQSTCSHCHRPLSKTAVLSPTLDEQRQEQCVECAGEWMKKNNGKEVVLAPEGTPLAEFQKARTDAMSRMFDRDDKKFSHKMCNQIHTTSQFYAELDEKVEQLLAQTRTEAVAEYRKEVEEAVEEAIKAHGLSSVHLPGSKCVRGHCVSILSDLKTKLNKLGKEYYE